MSDFANNLKQIRESIGITQEELAHYLALKRVSISGYETGRKEPNYDMLILIADYFKVSIDFLLRKGDVFSENNNMYLMNKNSFEDIKLLNLLHSRKLLHDSIFILSNLSDHNIENLNNLVKSLINK